MTKFVHLIRVILCIITLFVPFCGKAQSSVTAPEPGISYALAQHRAANIHDVEYSLAFDIPASADSVVTGHADISFCLTAPQQVVLDFFNAENEHIVIPASNTRTGTNTFHYEFTVDARMVNHRGNLVYTLSVPDKAHRLFPCFDQPDLKAKYHLTLTLPEGWTAVGNGAVTDTRTANGRTTVQFATTEPLSTYLFAFTAGAFERVTMTRNGRNISLYHCETDTTLTAQCTDILRETFDALDWLEAYTGIPYPYSKYDIVLVPGFQFGGMEHVGATLYNSRYLLLPAQATLDERLYRSTLIAHETAHMWFGDYVTMKWFGEVWTKEVFANYYGACIAEPLFPDVNHRLRFMLSYAPLAYAEDRSLGANPIQQELDNLSDAGMVYGNIVYDKSPMVMNQLVNKVGEETFRQGMQIYLRTYAHSNATWDALISILDSLTTEDLKSWSRSWVNESGMPVYRIQRKGRTLTIRQDEIVRPQKIQFQVDGIPVTANCNAAVTKLRLPSKQGLVLPNTDGMAYGYFALDSALLRATADSLEQMDDIVRGAQLINLYEALSRDEIAPTTYISWLLDYLPKEKNPLLFSMSVGNLRTAHNRYATAPNEQLEQALRNVLFNDTVPTRKLTALRTLMSVMDTPETIEEMYRLWKGDITIPAFHLSDVDGMALTYQLAVRLPEKADSLVAQQRRRLSSVTLQQEMDFESPAVSPRQSDRDSLFARLLRVENRKVEPWAETALAYLNHRYRRAESEQYLLPALEAVEEVKRTGDIFFPKRWVMYLVNGHSRETVREVVDRFLAAHPDYPLMLKRKILQNVY